MAPSFDDFIRKIWVHGYKSLLLRDPFPKVGAGAILYPADSGGWKTETSEREESHFLLFILFAFLFLERDFFASHLGNVSVSGNSQTGLDFVFFVMCEEQLVRR